MKKTVFGLSLALAALGFLMSPVLSEAEPAPAARALSAADQAFLASLAAPVGAPVPAPAARRPGIGGEKSLCNATANCWDGTTVSCGGNSSCTAVDSSCPGQRGSVNCDGVVTQCPACPCDLNCAEERTFCESDCAGCPFTFSCSLSTCTVSCHCNFRFCS